MKSLSLFYEDKENTKKKESSRMEEEKIKENVVKSPVKEVKIHSKDIEDEISFIKNRNEQLINEKSNLLSEVAKLTLNTVIFFLKNK